MFLNEVSMSVHVLTPGRTREGLSGMSRRNSGRKLCSRGLPQIETNTPQSFGDSFCGSN